MAKSFTTVKVNILTENFLCIFILQSVRRSTKSETKLENKLDKQIILDNNPGPWIPRQESRIILQPIIAPPPQPPPQSKPPEAPKLTPAQQRLKRAINIDRSSRVVFPCIFAILNMTYWIIFWEYI